MPIGPKLFEEYPREPESNEPAVSPDSDIVLRIYGLIEKARPTVLKQQQEMRKAHRYYAGHQWDELDLTILKAAKRPAITINEIRPIIDVVSGIERLNRSTPRFVSRSIGSKEVVDLAGDLATEAVATALDLSNGDYERSRAIKDVLIGGLGCVEVRMDYELGGVDGLVVVERVPWDEVWWDPNAIRENLEDRLWCARIREIPKSIFKDRWGEEKLHQALGQPMVDSGDIRKEEYFRVTPFYSQANQDANPGGATKARKPDTVKVIQFQERTRRKVYRFIDPETQEIREIGESEWKELKRRADFIGVDLPQAVESYKAVYQQTIIAGGVVLEGPTDLPGNFSLLFITGQYDHEKKIWYGLVRDLIDPQNIMNKSLSEALTIHLTNAKGGVMFESDAFEDPDVAKAQWSKPDAWIPLRPGGKDKIIQRQPVPMPTELGLFFTEAKTAMAAVAGVTQELTAQVASTVQTGTVQSRTRSSLMALGWLFDNVARYVKEEARVLLNFIREFWTHGQMIRIGGDVLAPAIPLLKENLPLEYDLVLDESVRHNPNLKAQVWQDLLPIIPAMLRFGFARFLLKALKFAPLPAELVQEIQREAVQGPPPEQARGRGKQETPEEKAAKVRKLTAEAERALAQARQYDAERIFRAGEIVSEALSEAQDRSHRQELDRHKVWLDVFKAAKMLLGEGANATQEETTQTVGPVEPGQGNSA